MAEGGREDEGEREREEESMEVDDGTTNPATTGKSNQAKNTGFTRSLVYLPFSDLFGFIFLKICLGYGSKWDTTETSIFCFSCFSPLGLKRTEEGCLTGNF